MLARDEKDLAKSLTSEMLRFGDHFIDVEGDAKNRIVARETAVVAVVNAFVGQIKRREQPHRSAKILQRERARSLRHRFEFLIRFRSDQMLEPLNELGFPQSQIVQGFDERHQHNFVRMRAFANTKGTVQGSACLKNPFPLPSASDSARINKRRRPVFRTPPC